MLVKHGVYVCVSARLGVEHCCCCAQKKRSTARAVLLRILQIALGISFVLMAALSFGRTAIPRVFTGDLEVIAVTQRIMPLLAFFMVSPALQASPPCMECGKPDVCAVLVHSDVWQR